jgi:hypothetical protein
MKPTDPQSRTRPYRCGREPRWLSVVASNCGSRPVHGSANAARRQRDGEESGGARQQRRPADGENGPHPQREVTPAAAVRGPAPHSGGKHAHRHGDGHELADRHCAEALALQVKGKVRHEHADRAEVAEVKGRQPAIEARLGPSPVIEDVRRRLSPGHRGSAALQARPPRSGRDPSTGGPSARAPAWPRRWGRPDADAGVMAPGRDDRRRLRRARSRSGPAGAGSRSASAPC